MTREPKDLRALGATFFAIGIAFMALGISGQRAFLGVGGAFFVLGILFMGKTGKGR